MQTSTTGYTQRKLLKAMEEDVVAFDRTVRNSEQDIVQFAYGNDGMDASLLEKQNLDLIMLDDQSLTDRYSAHEVHELVPLRDKLRVMKFSVFLQEYDTMVLLPFNIPRLLKQRRQGRLKKYVYTPGYYHTPDKWRGEVCMTRQKIVHLAAQCDSVCAQAAILSQLPESLCTECSAVELEWVCTTIVEKYQKGFAQAGEMVGALAAHCIGAPATQLTLNSTYLRSCLHVCLC